jgi:hypothetical protein
VLSDGIDLPIAPGSIDVAYSNQMIEHLHPDDAAQHVAAVHAALAPRGVFVCITPNRTTGPHDISNGFDPIATGLHLREYTARELAALLRGAGFTRIRAGIGSPAWLTLVPVVAVTSAEAGPRPVGGARSPSRTKALLVAGGRSAARHRDRPRRPARR